MDDDCAVLVIGATGFVGRRVVAALVAGGHRVRCMVRDPSRAADLSADGFEVVRGDMLDAEAVSAAARGVRAVIVCVHTLSPQPGRRAGQDFVDVEADGVGSIVAACRANGARRLLYVTSIGVAHGARSSWLRGRADVEDLLFGSGLDVTVLRPGMVVGHGGDGFGMVERGARRRAAILLASPHQRFRTVAVDDLAHQLVALLDEPRSFGQHFDVGSDDVLTIDEMVDLAANHLGRRQPAKIHLPRGVLAHVAPLIERAAKMNSPTGYWDGDWSSTRFGLPGKGSRAARVLAIASPRCARRRRTAWSRCRGDTRVSIDGSGPSSAVCSTSVGPSSGPDSSKDHRAVGSARSPTV